MTDPNPFRPEARDEDAGAKTGAGNGVAGAKPIPPAGVKSPVVESARPQIDSMRETLESIFVAFILAFLFRTFVAEAFVIPTGSMATTLMGRHKDVECPNCKFHYETSASQEADKDGNAKPKVHIEKTICPNCGMPVDTSDETKFPSYRGDRIIVSKVDSRGPRRWDVIVFRYPQEAGTNYIKRLVGLPGEEMRIRNGDLYVRPLDKPEAEFQILRKPPDVVLAMLRSVYDNDYVVDWMTKAGWPPRWQPCPMDMKGLLNAGWQRGNDSVWPWQPDQPSAPGQWTTSDGYRSFTTDGSAAGEVWLRYQHLCARDLSFADQPWRDQLWPRAPEKVASAFASTSKPPPPAPIKPTLYMINDFTGYNYGFLNLESHENPQRENPWVGDLAVGCEVSAADATGEVLLELIKGGHQFHCRLNLADRGIRLSADGETLPFENASGGVGAPVATAKQALPGKQFRVLFANVDGQLLVWVNDRLVEFDGPTAYRLELTQKDETPADYSPVGIAARGAHVAVNHVRVLRDVYYLPGNDDEVHGDIYRLAKNPYDPASDQFFVLGDNSPQSQDARLWPGKPWVERKLLIGKALFIFWPHSWDSPVPFTPNWNRMKFIR